MCNNEDISHQISLFRSLVHNRRFDDGTLRILESVLIIRDVKSLLDVRSIVIDFMRHESLCVLREFKEKSVDHQLLMLEFFVRAFALTGDVESCLALRYEGLALRELKSVTDHWLHVSYREWFTFAEHAFENKFYAIARKACEKALACFQSNDMVKTKDTDALSEDMEVIRKVKRLKDIAMVRAASRSVQAQAVEYLERKIAKHDKVSMLVFKEKQHSAIAKHDKVSMLVFKEKQHSAKVLFRNGIKKHNIRKLQELRRL